MASPPALLSPDGTEGGRDGEESEAKLIWVGRLKFYFFFPSSSYADAAIHSQETQVEKEGHL